MNWRLYAGIGVALGIGVLSARSLSKEYVIKRDMNIDLSLISIPLGNRTVGKATLLPGHTLSTASITMKHWLTSQRLEANIVYADEGSRQTRDDFFEKRDSNTRKRGRYLYERNDATGMTPWTYFAVIDSGFRTDTLRDQGELYVPDKTMLNTPLLMDSLKHWVLPEMLYVADGRLISSSVDTSALGIEARVDDSVLQHHFSAVTATEKNGFYVTSVGNTYPVVPKN